MEMRRIFDKAAGVSLRGLTMLFDLRDKDKRNEHAAAYAQAVCSEYTLHVVTSAPVLVKKAREKKALPVEKMSAVVKKLRSMFLGYEFLALDKHAACVTVSRAGLRAMLDTEDGDNVTLLVGNKLTLPDGGKGEATDVVTVLSADGRTMLSVTCDNLQLCNSLPFAWFSASVAGRRFWQQTAGVFKRAEEVRAAALLDNVPTADAAEDDEGELMAEVTSAVKTARKRVKKGVVKKRKAKK